MNERGPFVTGQAVPGAADSPDAPDPPVAGTDEPDGGDAIPQRMDQLLEATVDLEPPVTVSAAGSVTTYAVGGRPFAAAEGRAFEVQLGPEVAAAALRTPDVRPSGRGSGWVRLDPSIVDDHVADRAIAWFELARRIAAGHRAGGDDRPARA